MLPVLTLLLSLFTGGPDSLVLSDGATLEGRIESVDREGLVFLMEGAFQPRRVSWDELRAAALITDREVTLTLVNGDRVSGRLAGLEEGRLLLRSPHLGEISLALDSLISPEDVETVEDVRRESEVEREVERLTEEKDPDQILEPKDWTGKVGLVGTMRSGNTDAGLFRLQASIEKIWKRDRFRAGASYAYGWSEGETVANSATAAAKWDHYYTEDFYSYAQADLLYDEIQNLDLRAQVGIGAGWRVWHEGEDRDLSFEAGIAGLYQAFKDEDNQFDPTGRLAMIYNDIFFEKLDFGQTIELLVPLTDVGAYIVRAVTSVSMPLADNWALTHSLEIDYKGDPPPDTKAFDLLLTVGLEYTF